MAKKTPHHRAWGQAGSLGMRFGERGSVSSLSILAAGCLLTPLLCCLSVPQSCSVPLSSAFPTGLLNSSWPSSSNIRSTTVPRSMSPLLLASTWWQELVEPQSWPRQPTFCATTLRRRRSRPWSCSPRWRRTSPTQQSMRSSTNSSRPRPTHPNASQGLSSAAVPPHSAAPLTSRGAPLPSRPHW